MPQASALKREATYEDLFDVPEHLVAEILDGELHTSPRPGPRYAYAHSSLIALLAKPFNHGQGGPGGWLVLYAPELHLSRDIVVPDAAGWRRARMPRLPARAFFELVPDWACEIVSPSTAAIDRGKKLRIYAREGLAHLWLIDPLARTLEVLRLENGRWTILATHAGDEIVRAKPFEAIELRLALLWGEVEQDEVSHVEPG